MVEESKNIDNSQVLPTDFLYFVYLDLPLLRQ